MVGLPQVEPSERRVNSVIMLDSFISFRAYWWSVLHMNTITDTPIGVSAKEGTQIRALRQLLQEGSVL